MNRVVGPNNFYIRRKSGDRVRLPYLQITVSPYFVFTHSLAVLYFLGLRPRRPVSRPRTRRSGKHQHDPESASRAGAVHRRIRHGVRAYCLVLGLQLGTLRHELVVKE